MKKERDVNELKLSGDAVKQLYKSSNPPCPQKSPSSSTILQSSLLLPHALVSTER